LKKALFILLLFPLACSAQLSDGKQAQIDSLQKLIKTAQHDSVIINAWIAWDNIIYRVDPDMDFQLNQKIDSLCSINLKKKLPKDEKIRFLMFKSGAINNIGIFYKKKGDYTKAIEYYSKCLKIYEIIGAKSGIAKAFNNIGNIYNHQGSYDKAIEYYTKSLKITEEIGKKPGIAMCFNNIGIIYKKQGEYEKAIEYYSKSLQISEEIESKVGIANSLTNIGNIYYDKGETDEAIKYYTRSLKNQEEMGDKRGIASSYNNIGNIFHEQGEFTKALEFLSYSLKIKEEIGDKAGIAATLNNIGNNYIKQGEYIKALDYCNRSLNIAQEIGYAITIRDASEMLWILNKDLGRYTESLEMYELYVTTRDRMLSEENQKAIIQQEYKYAYEKQATADSIKAAEAGRVKDAQLIAEKAENKQIQQRQYFLYVGLVLALLFGGVIFNRFKLANKQKDIIEEQKKIVDKAYDGLEEAHREITDSINYAERIQRSFLATKQLLDSNLTEYFVFFQPKDVVSGDFYWAGELSDGNFAVVNADSTGHGVPGAIMSILNISSIESAVKDKLTEPAAIFNDTRNTIIERLKKDGSPEGGKDGMDASLLSFNKDKNKMTYVAAQNPIWIIRDGEINEIKAEKMPVGKHDKDHIPFNGGECAIEKGDQIYTITDGFQDQFGGPKGKKFMIKKMREYILSISHLSMKEQHQKTQEVFSNWKGELEQVDDVCVIGVRV